MPHIHLEYTTNIDQLPDFPALFKQCHQLCSDMVDAKIDACKSRVQPVNNFYVGNGDTNNAFVHAHIEMMPGRTDEQKQKLITSIYALLEDFFRAKNEGLNLQISVDVTELSNNYQKAPLGSA